jgi:hypothetical protein
LVWRAGNLVGWGLAGTVAAFATFAILGRVLIVVSPRPGVAITAAVMAAGVADGLVVGSRVYRSPRLIAALSMLVPVAFLTLGMAVSANGNVAWLEVAIVVAAPIATCAVAAVVAGARFARRPRVLRRV